MSSPSPPRRLPRAFWILLVGMFVNRAGGFVAPFLALYLVNERHLGVAEAGSIIALGGLGSLGAGPAGGMVSDRWGRRPALALATTGGAAAMVALGLTRTPEAIAVAAVVLGFFGEMYRAPCQAMVADIVPEGQRERAFGLIYWAVNLGFAIGPTLAGVIAAHSYAALFYADAATTLFFGLFVVASVHETRPHDPHPHRGLREYTVPYLNPLFLAFAFFSMLIGALFHQIGTSLPMDLTQRGIAPGTYGLLISLNGVLITVLQPVISPITRRSSRSRVLPMGASLIGLGMGINGLAHGVLAIYVLSIVIWTLGEIMIAGISPAIVAEMAPAHLRGTYQGAFLFSFGFSASLGPLAGSALLAHWGSEALWAGCLVAGLVAAAGFAVTVPVHSRRLSAQRADNGAVAVAPEG